MKRSGRCLCGSLEFVVSGPPKIVAHCHCLDCQRWTGCGHSTAAMYPKRAFKLKGNTLREVQVTAENGHHVTRGFCENCGSPIFGCNDANEEYLSILLGVLDNSDDLVPEASIFCRSQKTWDPSVPDLPSFPTQPSWKPGSP